MTPSRVLVIGRFVADEHVYEAKASLDPARQGPALHVARELGGAGVVVSLLKALAPAGDWAPEIPAELPTPARRVSIWRPKATAGGLFWHAADTVLMPLSPAADVANAPGRRPEAASDTPRIVVVFGSSAEPGGDRSQAATPGELTGAHWIVAHPKGFDRAENTWSSVSDPGRRLVLIVGADRLREMPVRLGRGVSWEDTLQDLARGLAPGGGLERLTHCRHLVVTCGTEGAVWFDFGGGASTTAAAARVHLVYAAAAVEGDTASLAVPGSESCIVAAVAHQLAVTGVAADVDLVPALDAGLCGMRDLLQRGHGPAQEQASGFPAARVADAMNAKSTVFSRATFALGDAAEPGWTLFGQSQRGAGPAFDLARLVVLRGSIALSNLPHVRLGPYITVDRREAEVVRRLQHLVRRYAAHETTRPLSIGVFGPPGAGKSFAVKQLAKSIPKSEWLEFNLSQWHDPAELTGALHRVRDAVLEGLLPVAFFDEFDSQNYMWLKHLLAPMQDGRFQDGQIVHPLGKCVLIFAGGTSWTRETFGPPPADPPRGDEPTATREFRLAKGTDFISRLDDYLDVVGPNARQVVVAGADRPTPDAEYAGGRWWVTDPADLLFPVRRALMIRAELRCAEDERLDIDDGLVHALIHVEKYVHGARSLTKLLRPFVTARPAPLRRSMLPPHGQLALHVDASSFLRLCDNVATARPPSVLSNAIAHAVMAAAVHEAYRELGRRAGTLKREHDEPFSALGEFDKATNLAAAERMLAILPLAGLALESGPATPDEESAVRAHLEYRIEVLAQEEHDGWMAWHFSQGWRYAPKTEKSQRLHQCLRPYAQLPLRETDKDRNAIRNYPEIARAAGMKLGFAERGE